MNPTAQSRCSLGRIRAGSESSRRRPKDAEEKQAGQAAAVYPGARTNQAMRSPGGLRDLGDSRGVHAAPGEDLFRSGDQAITRRLHIRRLNEYSFTASQDPTAVAGTASSRLRSASASETQSHATTAPATAHPIATSIPTRNPEIDAARNTGSS